MDLETHVVVMDSRYFYGGDLWSRQYYFDWSVIPDGKYELTFSFMGDPAANLNDNFSLFSNMISPQNVYQASGRIGANSVAFLGNLCYVGYNSPALTLTYLFADQTTNPPVICNRPMNNIFTIGIFDGFSGANNVTTPAYILTLYFKPLRLGLA
jgi:hypothetical protein